jgi:carbon monoxide dehydrogenase subunit G
MKMEVVTEIERSPADVWPWLTEPERMKQWMKGLVSVESTDGGPTRAGSTAKVVIKEGGRLATYDEKILEWEPQRLLLVSMTGAHCPGLEMRCGNRLEDLGGRTRLHYQFECRTTRTLFKVMGALFGFFAKLQAKSFMRSLKRLVEGERSAAARAVTAS